jgi:hypothetical protein
MITRWLRNWRIARRKKAIDKLKEMFPRGLPHSREEIERRVYGDNLAYYVERREPEKHG